MGTAPKRTLTVAIAVAALAATALFLAQGTTRLLAASVLEAGAPAAGRPAARPAHAAAGPTRKDPTAMLRRNIFDSELGPLDGERVELDPAGGEGGGEEVAVELDPNAPLPRCDGAVRLVGSLYNTGNPDWSFAAITGPSGKAMLYRAGMEVEGRHVLAIQPSTVVLRPASGSPCQLSMFTAGEEPAAARPNIGRPAVAAAEVPEAPEREGAITTAEMEAGISRVSDTQFGVTRGLVDKLLENQAELMRTARIIPHEENGRTVGVKLYGIRRNSLLGRLGLQNGDMLRTINGYDMTSPDSALEAYSRLRSSDNLTVSVVRRGQGMTIDYRIQ